jgi:competence protein ComEA
VKKVFHLSRQEQLVVVILVGLIFMGGATLAFKQYRLSSANRAYAELPPGNHAPAVDGNSGEAKPDGQPPLIKTGGILVIHVAGAVRNPGVYRLDKGARVVEAIEAAGGPLPDGQVHTLNLASLLSDGEKVYVPTRKEVQAAQGGYGGPTGSRWPSGEGGYRSKININLAGPGALEALPGVGPSLAQRIIEHRTRNGPFKKIEGLMDVPGIGEKKFEKIKDWVTVN